MFSKKHHIDYNQDTRVMGENKDTLIDKNNLIASKYLKTENYIQTESRGWKCDGDIWRTFSNHDKQTWKYLHNKTDKKVHQVVASLLNSGCCTGLHWSECWPEFHAW